MTSSKLTERLEKVLAAKPATKVDLDYPGTVDDILEGTGIARADTGGKLSFIGGDPLIAAACQYGGMAGTAAAAKAIAAAAIWKDRTGQDQDIHVDVRKVFKRFMGFSDGKWQLINGRPPALKADRTNPFFVGTEFRLTKDGRYMCAFNIYPRLLSDALTFLDCAENDAAIDAAIKKWNADELEEAASKAGIVMAKVRTTAEMMKEVQYKEVLSKMPLVWVEKIGETAPIPFKAGPITMPLDGVRALGRGHVIAGAGIGRDLASYGADVLNTWAPEDYEIEPFFWDTQVGMRSTYLALSKKAKEYKVDRAVFDTLLKDADIFFSNRHPGFLEANGLTAEDLCKQKPGLIHTQVLMHGATGPWKFRPGFDEIGATVSGVFMAEGTGGKPSGPPMLPVCDNVVGWLGVIGTLAALRRRAKEGGSYRVRVSLTRTCLWLISLGLLDKDFAKQVSGTTAETTPGAPDVFTAESGLGTYQGMTDQVVFSKMKQGYRTVLNPMGFDKPVWLP